jgi:O-succinylbenzoate synthase
LAGALPELDLACGLGTLALLQGDVVPDDSALRPAGGYLPVLRTPPVPDPALLDTYELTDPSQVAWWRERLCRVSFG